MSEPLSDCAGRSSIARASRDGRVCHCHDCRGRRICACGVSGPEARPAQGGARAFEIARPRGSAANLARGSTARRRALEQAFEAARSRLERPATSGDGIDVTLPGVRPRLGHRHPLTQTADELIDIFGRFGFSVARGPEVEDVYHNFDALNIPPNHPARDPFDNFYLAASAGAAGKKSGTASSPEAGRAGSDGRVSMLRSQTSTIQIRVMESQPPPVRVIAIGRVYRPDAVDATHSFMFHQIEGLMVDRGVTMAHLKSVLRLFAESYLGKDVKIRFRPSFFPFTEPSVEVDMLWHGGERWVEMGGAGMVDPNVLRSVGYDPEDVTGFAFGLGIERLCMRRHKIDDIRLLFQNDVRFLRQF